jgi:branched-chain amino acid transport system ATP-binding protein
MSSKAMLSVNGIEVIYNHVILVLKGVSLEVQEGGIVALLGANGAGKTTTLKAISNLLRAERGDVTKGSITFRDQRIYQLNPSELVKRGKLALILARGVGSAFIEPDVDQAEIRAFLAEQLAQR